MSDSIRILLGEALLLVFIRAHYIIFCREWQEAAPLPWGHTRKKERMTAGRPQAAWGLCPKKLCRHGKVGRRFSERFTKALLTNASFLTLLRRGLSYRAFHLMHGQGPFKGGPARPPASPRAPVLPRSSRMISPLHKIRERDAPPPLPGDGSSPLFSGRRACFKKEI